MTTKRGAGARRRRSAASYRKLAISVPSRLVKAVQGEVRAHHAGSVSAFISDAVEEKLQRDLLQDALDEVWRERPMTAKELAWAKRILAG
jgi:hypothetical protein